MGTMSDPDPYAKEEAFTGKALARASNIGRCGVQVTQLPLGGVGGLRPTRWTRDPSSQPTGWAHYGSIRGLVPALAKQTDNVSTFVTIVHGVAVGRGQR